MQDHGNIPDRIAERAAELIGAGTPQGKAYKQARTELELQPETLERGDTLTDFHGERWTFLEWAGYKVSAIPAGANADDRAGERTFYAGVFSIRDPRLNEESS